MELRNLEKRLKEGTNDRGKSLLNHKHEFRMFDIYYVIIRNILLLIRKQNSIDKTKMYCYNTDKCTTTLQEKVNMREEFEGLESGEIAEIIFHEEYIISKKQLFEALGRYVKKAKSKKGVSIFKECSSTFKNVYLDLLMEFYNEVKQTPLFEELEPYWFYSFKIDEAGATLSLCHANNLGVDIEDEYIDSISIDACFELVTKKARVLSVEEYAEKYSVSVGTVRQWIRRAKIRGADKTASGWRISELCEVREGKYTTGNYYFDSSTILSKDYPFLAKCESINIGQNSDCAELFDISLWGKEIEDYIEIQMNRQEREKFELFLITHPEVRSSKKIFVESDLNCEMY